ncbi:hypothetical protein BD408DRAFT_475820 [Parasitella parasitica]|nr:hypothetical protein BD408DRAFT_475820 [Parasitella parasitica]
MSFFRSFIIELLPEFGWSVKDLPVYRFVKLNLKLLDLVVERVPLAFCAAEMIPPFELSLGVLRTTKQTLFYTQQVLWESKQHVSTLNTNVNYSFPFTIQMPMVQFPPSMDHNTSIIFMPYIETNILKLLLSLEAAKAHLSVKVKMSSQDFIPGISILISLDVKSNKLGPANGSFQYVTAHLKLVQTLQIHDFNDISKQTATVANVAHKLLMVKSLSAKGSYCHADLELELLTNITPSYDYGSLVEITDKLYINVEQKGPLGGIWNYNPSNTKLMPLPKFMKAIEYEDALPLYDASRLPDYESPNAIHS